MTDTNVKKGEYVRTSFGFIAKVIEIDKNGIDFDNYITIRYGERRRYLYPREYTEIVKHSFNIANILDARDFVELYNDNIVQLWHKDQNTLVYKVEETGEWLELKENVIQSVITKEMFWRNAYNMEVTDDK